MPVTPIKIRTLQRKLYVKAKQEPAAILIMATVNHFMLSQLSKLARLEAEMSRNIDFHALLAPEMAGITFVAFDQQP